LQQLILLRKKQAAFHPNSGQEILDFGTDLFVLKREAKDQKILVIINLSNEEKEIEIPDTFTFDLISDSTISSKKMSAYQCLWLTQNRSIK